MSRMKKIAALFLCLAILLSGTNANAGSGEAGDSLEGGAVIQQTLKTDPITFTVEIPEKGIYRAGMSYRALDDAMDPLVIGLLVDGSYPGAGAEGLVLPRMWQDGTAGRSVDDYGNEYPAEQVPYEGFYFWNLRDGLSREGMEFMLELEAGEHEITLVPVRGSLEIESVVFSEEEEAPAYTQPETSGIRYQGEPIVLEGEDADLKSSYFLVGKSDGSTVRVTPHSPDHSVVNYIGGGNWKDAGETIFWQTPYLTEGYYQIGFSYRQNAVIGGKTYRCLTIDGKVPFQEAEAVGFSYGDNWQQQMFAPPVGEPYLIYFTEGVHTIGLTVTYGEILKVQELLEEAIARLGELYVDITVITGEKVDVYRDYELFSQIPDMEGRLWEIHDLLTAAAEQLREINQEDSGSHYSVIMNMIQAVDLMLENKFEAHRYKNYYYTNYCSVSSVLQELCSMPLDLDRIVLTREGEEEPFGPEEPLEQIFFSVKRFLASFQRDYNGVSKAGDSDSITIWVNWGRDQAQVLSSLVERSFTPQTGIDVNIKLTNASVIQATLSGDGPDCVLQQSRSEPVNLGMRGVLYDLTEFEDCKEVLGRFQEGAEIPYRYQDGLYALPDTQNFYMMFYRKDILEQFGIRIPETWEEFQEASRLLMRYNMTVWMQNSPATDPAQVNAGVGSSNIFPSMLLQRDLSLYQEDGRRTTLLEPETMETFKDWTDYYTKQKFPVTLNFYNRFRTGTTPLGIAPYTMYTTLKVTAPEIDGLWGMTMIPGTVREDGTVSHVSSGGGTGCAILKQSEHPQMAWEFLKWWTSAETQQAFSNDVESILGPTGRIALSNVEGLEGLSWDPGMWEELLAAWEQTEEIPEYPGSYYVSRSIYQSYWNVVNARENTKDMMMKYGKEANEEITRKWLQYQGREQ